ncbi:restriction endonuclease subunit S [Legionella pneumophila]|uniref:restriction endonuclease subunit S n=1 Tax=Legionella pneumophila TaxID=446 RepID=UPI0007709C77|nr:restriction endonuclease subunit S [Legionella pneumophila]CZO83617.1 Type I restriction enzyme EcoKI specificity protein [Legionella pneumophila]
MKPYSSYKNSSEKWLNKIPEHWNFKRAKSVFKIIDIRSQDGSEELLSVSEKQGVALRKNTNVTMFQAANYAGYKLCWPQDLVINSLWAWMTGLGFSEYHGIISTAYSVFRIWDQEKFNYKYGNYLLRSKIYNWEFRVRSKGIWRSRYQLSDDSFLSMPLLLPPLSEQQQIAIYLDWKTTKINKFIQAKKKLIALLKEQKQNIINEAVTKGINPDVNMKDSGVDWLGEIPEHWEIRKLKYVATKFGSGVTPKGGATVYQDSGIPFLRSQNIHFEGIKLENVAYISNDVHKRMSSSHVKPNDVLLNITGASIGRTCYVPSNLEQANVNQHVCIIRPIQKKVSSQYLAFYLSIPLIQRKILEEQNGASREGLTLSSIKRLNVILPTFNEQMDILNYISTETSVINKTIKKAELEIELIQEFRTRLISDVVTGKIDVSSVKVPDFEPIEADADVSDEGVTEELVMEDTEE